MTWGVERATPRRHSRESFHTSAPRTRSEGRSSLGGSLLIDWTLDFVPILKWPIVPTPCKIRLSSRTQFRDSGPLSFRSHRARATLVLRAGHGLCKSKGRCRSLYSHSHHQTTRIRFSPVLTTSQKGAPGSPRTTW